MNKKDTLLVTFPVDLGNKTIGYNLQKIFAYDMDFYCFAQKHADKLHEGKIKQSRSLFYRLSSTYELRKIVSQYTGSGRKILFNGLSPALFSYGCWTPEQTAVVFDWTRTLYPHVKGEKALDKGMAFKIHKQVLSSCKSFLCWTDSIMENLTQIYEVDPSFLHKAPAPFLVAEMDIPPRKTPTVPRVLFVGGDLKRKGGDVLLKAWKTQLQGRCSLTMMTAASAEMDGVHFLPGIEYGSPDHKKAYENSDILVLPTRMDAYPQVIGEAAAAGLAVITTRYALGANEIIENGKTGFITETPEDTIPKLLDLLNNSSLLEQFKTDAYNSMHHKFNADRIRNEYLKILYGKAE